jgi:dolichyl-phosphate-mannose-protein mannosyltransferase
MNEDGMPSDAEENPPDEPADTDVDEPEVALVPSWAPRPAPSLRRVDLIVLLLILIVTGATRFVRLSEPGPVLPPTDKSCVQEPPLGKTCYTMIPTDEVHYVPDARNVLQYGTESDKRVTVAENPYVVHPPVGKWFIAAGMKIFGDRPFGWRFFGAFFGTLSVLIMYLLALRLWRSPWWAATAATLLAADGLWFVQSRVAMLDIYMAVFVLAGVWLLLKDRDETHPDHTGIRWWRLAAGAMFGLALSTKWAAAPFVVVGIAMSLSWDVGREKASDHSRIPLRTVGAFGALVLLPLSIYISTYTPWFADTHRYNPPLCQAPSTTFSLLPGHLLKVHGLAGQWLCYQGQIANFHKHLEKYNNEATTPGGPIIRKPGHPYYGFAWSWPWIGRPVAMYYKTTGVGTQREDAEVLGLPNPFIWWPGFFIGLIAIAWWAYRRDATAALILAFFIAGFAPYIFADIVDRAVFMFYATPLVPFVVLTVVHVMVKICKRWPEARAYLILYVVGVVGAFAYFYPILAGLPIPYSGIFGWARHMWFSDRFHFFNIRGDCLIQNKIKTLCWI